MKAETRVRLDDNGAVRKVAAGIVSCLLSVGKAGPLAIVCIGSDRSTGDALGPLVGSALQSRMPWGNIYGTLDDPVHAENLVEWKNRLRSWRGPILAVDAGLGNPESVGSVCVRTGPLEPGTGVGKDLPDMGDLNVTGVVNVDGFMGYYILQNTRLSIVMKLAELIAGGVATAAATWEKEGTPATVEIGVGA